MFLSLVTLIMSAGLAAATDCSLDQILQQAKPDQKCVEHYLSGIANEEDRSETKYRLTQWKPLQGLSVDSEDGLIQALKGQKLLFRTILLKREKPMILWMDGKILVDNSDNPSFARRLDNVLKKNKMAEWSLLPQAWAEQGQQLRRDLTLFYAMEDFKTWGSARNLVAKNDPALRGFLGAPSWLHRQIVGAKEIKCSDPNTVATTRFLRDGTSGLDTELMITPRSETEFLVRGLKSKQTHLISLKDWEVSYVGHTRRTLLPHSAGIDATLSTCADTHCERITKTDKMRDWNFLLRLDPEQEQRDLKVRSKINNETFKQVNAEYQAALVGRLFGLSVMGTCCGSSECRDEMLKNYQIRLQPAAEGESRSTH